jgi:hypothetical protein
MRAFLVRVAVDQKYGGWNSPMDPETNEFVYVPIPEGRPMRAKLATSYKTVEPALERFARRHPSAPLQFVRLPSHLNPLNMHLDPDFEHLTYGDGWRRRGKPLVDLGPGDVIVFYGGLRPVAPREHRLVYALVGLCWVDEVVRAESVEEPRWHENAHTRVSEPEGSDVIVRGEDGSSGRLRRCIPIGEYRDNAYRITREILDAWGGSRSKMAGFSGAVPYPSSTSLTDS